MYQTQNLLRNQRHYSVGSYCYEFVEGLTQTRYTHSWDVYKPRYTTVDVKYLIGERWVEDVVTGGAWRALGDRDVLVTVSSIKGFSGQVALSTLAPSGVVASISPGVVEVPANGSAEATLTIGLPDSKQSVARAEPHVILVRAHGGGLTRHESFRLGVIVNVDEVTDEMLGGLGYVNAWDSTWAQGIRYVLDYRKGWTSTVIREVARSLGYRETKAIEVANRFETRVDEIVKNVPNFVVEFVKEYLKRVGTLPTRDELADGIRAYLWTNLTLAYADSWVEATLLHYWTRMLRNILNDVFAKAIGATIGEAAGLSIGAYAAYVGKGLGVYSAAKAGYLLGELSGELVGQGAEAIASHILNRAEGEGGEYIGKRANLRVWRQNIRRWVYELNDYDYELGINRLVGRYAEACLSGGNYSRYPYVPDW